MVRIRLRRHGAKGQPTYRIVVTDSQKPRDGRFIEILGHYNPRTDPATFKVEAERAQYWLSVGAQPSDAVRRLLVKTGVLTSDLPLADEQPLPEPEAVEAEAADESASEPDGDEGAEADGVAAADEVVPEPEASEEPTPEPASEETAGD